MGEQRNRNPMKRRHAERAQASGEGAQEGLGAAAGDEATVV